MPTVFEDIVSSQSSPWLVLLAFAAWNGWLHWQLRGSKAALSAAYADNKHLSSQLQICKNQIDQIIERRTAELEEGNLQLKTTNIELFEKQEKLNQTIAELTHTQNRVVQSEKLRTLGFITAGIAHHINNPMNYISAATNVLIELLNRLEDNPEELQEQKAVILYAKTAIETGIERTVSIISSLRNYAVPQNKKCIEYDVTKCIDDALFLVQSNSQESCKILMEMPEELTMDCDPGKLTQMFVHLLSNALEATNGKGSISMRGYKEDDQVSFEISDSGNGIDKDDLKRIFEPFFTTKEIGKGQGLGLYITQGIIRQHGGEIHVSSQKGIGTKVHIQLPLHCSPAPQESQYKNQYNK